MNFLKGGGAEHQADKLFKRTWILRLKFSQMMISLGFRKPYMTEMIERTTQKRKEKQKKKMFLENSRC